MTVPAIVCKILHAFSDSLAYDVNTFFPDLINKYITEGAFSIARYKIDSEYFHELLRSIVKHACKSLPAKTWNNYRVLAIDGTTISVPTSSDTIKHLGISSTTSNGKKSVMANALMVYDVLSEIVIDAEIGSYKTSEKELLEKVMRNNNFKGSVLVADRNFGCFYFYKQLITNNYKFCIRQKASKLSFSKLVMADDRDDFITYWKPSEKERQSTRLKGLDVKPIRVRVTKIILPNGEVELLISNLFESSITSKQIGKLYNLRWIIEEGYKHLKPRQKLELFGSRKTQGIYQEYYAQLVMMNISAMFSSIAEISIKEKTENRDYTYKVNKTNAWKYIKASITKLMDPLKFIDEIEQILKKIKNTIVRIVPDRSEPRSKKKNVKHRLSPNYK